MNGLVVTLRLVVAIGLVIRNVELAVEDQAVLTAEPSQGETIIGCAGTCLDRTASMNGAKRQSLVAFHPTVQPAQFFWCGLDLFLFYSERMTPRWFLQSDDQMSSKVTSETLLN